MPGGRPRKYKSTDELQQAIDKYFAENEFPTVCGLALALGFSTRQSLINYEGYSGEFLDIIKTAKLRIEDSYEHLLINGKQAAGPIFALKNMSWSDKQELEHSGEVKMPGFCVNVPK